MPAERAYGCFFAEKFQSQNDVEANEGTMIGSPTFNSEGMTLTSSDAASYDIEGIYFKNTGFSVVIEFTPNWNGSDGLEHNWFDTTAGNRYNLRKKINNDLQLVLGGTAINIPYATWSPHYLQGQKNILVIYCENTDNNVMLNGNMILDSNVAGWGSFDPSTLWVGANNSGTANFSGTFHELKFFSHAITSEDADHYSDKTMFNYDQYLVAYWPTTNAQDDTNLVKDVINGYHLNKQGTPLPVKRTTGRGYTFDGTSQHLRVDDTGHSTALSFSDESGSLKHTISVWIKMIGRFDSQPFISKGYTGWAPSEYRVGTISDVPSARLICYIYDDDNGNTARGRITSGDLEHKQGKWLLFTSNSIGGVDPQNEMSFYIDGVRYDDSAAGAGTPFVQSRVTNEPLTFARLHTQYFEGQMAMIRYYHGYSLSAIQQKDLWFREVNLLNNTD